MENDKLRKGLQLRKDIQSTHRGDPHKSQAIILSPTVKSPVNMPQHAHIASDQLPTTVTSISSGSIRPPDI